MPSVYPVNWTTTTFRGHYPNMAKRDVEVWTRFLNRHAADFSGFAYDVGVGGLRVSLPDFSDDDADAWQYHTALKIDACGMTDTSVWVIEVKPEAQVGALGAVLAYTMVLDRERVFELPLQSVLVCEYVQPDVDWCCAQLGITVVKV
jgi:hypothetical protein